MPNVFKPRENGDIPMQKAYRCDVIFGQHPANAVEGWSNKGQEATDVGLSLAELEQDLSIFAAALFQCIKEEIQFS
jgi:hypothetical protein